MNHKYRNNGPSFLKAASVNTGFKDKTITVGMTIAIFAILGILVDMKVLGSLIGGLLIPMCYYIIMSTSLNLTVGILGELSLGHAGFMCVGAYVGGIFSLLTQETITSAWIRFPLALLIGGLAAALFGILIGMPILRLRGDYLAIVTLAFGEIIRNLIQNIYIAKDVNGIHFSFASAIPSSELDMATKVDIIKGPMALNGIPQDSTLIISVILVVITLIVLLNLIDSRSGRAIMSIRDNRIAAESTGINITKYKLLVFAISAFFAGIAGVLYAHCSTVTPTKFNYNLSIMILVYVVLGKIGNMRGAVIATMILYMLPEVLRGLQTYRMLFYAIILIVIMLLNNNEKFNTWKNSLAVKIKLLFKKKEAK